jgi:hypothetical protein
LSALQGNANSQYNINLTSSSVSLGYLQVSPTTVANYITVNNTGTTIQGALTCYNAVSVQGALTCSNSITCPSINCSGKVSGYTSFCSGKINSDGTKAFKSASSEVDFTSSLISTGTYTITFSSAHPAGANYVIQLTSYYSVVSVRSTVAPSSTGFGVVTWAASSPFPTGQNNAFYFTVAY